MLQLLRFACVTVILFCLSATAHSATTAFIGATLIDGTGKPASANAIILVEDDRIVEVGPNVNIPEHAQRIDATGKWIVPGLIDSHIH